MTALEALAYEAALRTLDKQEELLKELRARTGVLLAASSLTASLLGGKVFDDLDPLVLTLLALGAFAVSLASCLYVLTPRTRLVFSLDGPALYEALYEFRDDSAEVHRRVAYQLHDFSSDNESELAPLLSAYRLAAAALALEVVLLVALVSGILG